MPRALVQLSRKVKRKAWQLMHPGDRVECPCCGVKLGAFMPTGVVPRPNAECPVCGSRERHRFHALLLSEHGLLGEVTRPVRCLFVAPDRATALVLDRASHCRVTTTDLFLPDVDVRADLTALPMEGGAFESVLCSNVLEHVRDDRAAMRELFRVLHPEGTALVDVPIRPDGAFDEDVDVTDPDERFRRFGGRDHFRWYDDATFSGRLREAGFVVRRVDPRTDAETDRHRRHRLGSLPVYLLTKPVESTPGH